MGSLPPERAGVGSAVNDTTRQTGGALGVAVLGSIFAFQYHRVIDATTGISPSRSTTCAIDREVARGGPRRRRRAGARLVDAAQHAFISSMRITFGVAAVVVLFAALVAAKFLPARAAETDETLSEEVADSLVVGVETAT